MEIVTDLKQFRNQDFPNLVVALGNFDGVHLGHLRIISTVRERATKIGGTSAVFTFKEHPQRILHRKEDPPILTSLIHKLILLEQAGVDLCFLIDFTLALSKKEPEDFVREIFIETLGAREVCLGFNARFGRDRSGDSKLMKRLAEKYQFTFLEAPQFEVDKQVVSSSTIRSLVREGKLSKSAELLGRPYSVFGTVISGSGRGKELGFPTANLELHSEVMPPEGVYAVWVRILDCRLTETKKGWAQIKEQVKQERLKGLLNYGRRPTFGIESKPVAEVHILNFSEDITNKTVEITIGERLRAEQAFPSRESLQNQVKHDIEAGQKWFAKQA